MEMNRVTPPLYPEVALHCLAHPLSLLSILLLLVNDHVLKQTVPSWLTGKLSDFAGLFFFPFLLALICGEIHRLQGLLAVRRRAPGTARPASNLLWPWVAASALTALGFTLLKICPPANALAESLLSAPWRGPVQIAMDPSDLLALLVLLPGGWLWCRKMRHPPLLSPPRCSSSSRETAASQPLPLRRSGGRRWLIVAAAALASLATTPLPPPDIGVMSLCLEQAPDQGELIIAFTDYNQYTSADGGLSWSQTGPESTQSCKRSYNRQRLTDWEVPGEPAAANPATAYRYDPKQGILRSVDGGQTWQLELPFSAPSEAQQLWRRLQQVEQVDSRLLEFEFVPGPLDSLYVEKTGSLVLAMGLEGVLVRSRAGQWQWVQVGPYLRSVGLGLELLQVLSGELWLGVWAALLALSLMAQQVKTRVLSIFLILLSLVGFGFLFSIQTHGEPLRFGYVDYGGLLQSALIMPLIIAGLLSAIPVLVNSNELSGLPGRNVLRMLLGAVAVFLAYMAPFVLWCYAIIATYREAFSASLILTVLMLAGMLVYFGVYQEKERTT